VENRIIQIRAGHNIIEHPLKPKRDLILIAHERHQTFRSLAVRQGPIKLRNLTGQHFAGVRQYFVDNNI
jgi:hypothetical protein